MFATLEAVLLSFASAMPLPAFAAIASFVEEILVPIPSGPVMVVTGSIAQVQGYALPLLLMLAVCASIGKVFGSLVVYWVADKAEDVVSGKFARFAGISHAQIEAFGARFGKGWKDYVLLTLLRTLPFVPSAVVSFGSGVLRIPLRLFVITTFVGSILRDLIYLYLGYAGIAAAGMLLDRFSTIESLLQGLIVLGVVAAVGVYVYLHRKK